MNKGQITTGTLIVAAIGLGGLIFTLFGINTYSIVSVDNQVKSVVKDVSEKGEKIATNEANITNIQTQLKEIKDQNSEILRLLRK